MPKNSSNPEYSRDREFKVILEDLQGQFRVFGEGLELVQSGLETVKSGLEIVKSDLETVKIDMVSVKIGLKAVNQKVDRMDYFMQKVLPEVATKDDLRRLENRLTRLETTR